MIWCFVSQIDKWCENWTSTKTLFNEFVYDWVVSMSWNVLNFCDLLILSLNFLQMFQRILSVISQRLWLLRAIFCHKFHNCTRRETFFWTWKLQNVIFHRSFVTSLLLSRSLTHHSLFKFFLSRSKWIKIEIVINAIFKIWNVFFFEWSRF